jgi:hypothetical protein
MATLGRNIRSAAPLSARDRIRAFWIGVFGCDHMSPRADVDVFAFRDGSRIGVYFVDDADALDDEQHRKGGTWIEIRVDDEQAMRDAIAAAGAARLSYHDDGHAYFQAPGGQIFRVAA